MRTFFESIEGKMRNELASAIDYRMLSVCFIHLFRNRKIVHKENLIGNLSLPVSLILFDVEKPRPTSFLAGRVDPLRVLRNTESSLRSRVHNFSLRKHLFGKYLLLSRSQPCAGLVFKKMESLFCSDDPDFYSSFPSFKGFRLRIKSVLLRLISFVSHFSYDKGRKQSTQRRCFLFSKKNARSLIEVANCLGLLINNAFIAQCREGSHRKSSHFKKGKAPYCDTRSTRLSFILFLNLFRKLHNNSARFLHDQGSTRRGARLFSRSTRNNCRLDYIGIQKISQGLRGISRHKEIRFILFIRGLISNLSLATKFYSSTRRPLSIVF